MATVDPVKIFPNRNDVFAFEWTLTENDVATAVEAPWRSDKTAQISGDFGGGDINIEGSIDPDQAVFSKLTDPQGNTIAPSAAAIETIMENVFFIRPGVPSGSAAVIVVRILMA